MPHAGLDAMERGSLVHRVLEAVWRKLGTKAALDAISAPDLDALVAQAAEEAIARIRRERPAALAGVSPRSRSDRLARLARAWLEVERGARRTSRCSPPRTSAPSHRPAHPHRPARPRRRDRGRRAHRHRLQDRQAVALRSDGWASGPTSRSCRSTSSRRSRALSRSAFAQVKAGEMKFVGARARGRGVLPGVKTPAQVRCGDAAGLGRAGRVWRAELDAAGGRVRRRRARTLRRRSGPKTCRKCDVQPFCRIHERLGARPR